MTNPTPEALIKRAVRRLQSARRELWDSEVHPSDGKVHDTDVLAEIRELDELIAALSALATSAPLRYSLDYVADMEGSLQQIANAVGVDMRDGSKTADDIIAAVKRLATSARTPAGWKLVLVEPTLKQLAALGPAIRACYEMDGKKGNVRDVYAAALNSAPPAPPAAQPLGRCARADAGIIECLCDPAQQLRCAEFKRYSTAPAAEAAEPSKLRDPRMEPFDKLGPLPGMISAFELHYGQSWTDKDWRSEALTWAAAWKAASARTAQAGSGQAQMDGPDAEDIANMRDRAIDLNAEQLHFEARRGLFSENGTQAWYESYVAIDQLRDALATPPAQAEPKAGEAVAMLTVQHEDDSIWRGTNFIGLTDAGRKLTAGTYQLYTRPAPAAKAGEARDAARLDWIERRVCDVSRLGDSARTIRIAWNNGADHVDVGPHCFPNWRDAIDAAMARASAAKEN